MANDYDAPRNNDTEPESITALQGRSSEKPSGSVDVDADNLAGMEFDLQSFSDADLNVVVLPPQEDELTCVECFLVLHRARFDDPTSKMPVCQDCAA